MLAFIDDIFSENISDSSLVKQATHKKSHNLHTSNPSMQQSVKLCAHELWEDSDFVTVKTQKHICGAVCVKYEDAKQQKQITDTVC